MTQYSLEQLAGLAGESLMAVTCLSSLQWIYRHQPIADIGIDGEIEVLDEQHASTGKILKVQVKSRVRDAPAGVTVSPKHYSYWALLTVPVIICSASPEENQVVWWPAAEGRLATSNYHYDLATSRTLDSESRQELNELSGSSQLDFLSGLANVVCDASSQFESINPALFTNEEEAAASELEGISSSAISVIKFLSQRGLGGSADTHQLAELEERLLDSQKRLHRSLVRMSKERACE